MKRAFVRSALLDEHFYAFVNSDGDLCDEGGKLLHESFAVVEPLNYKHFLAAIGGLAVISLLYWVCFSPSLYDFSVSLCEVCNA